MASTLSSPLFIGLMSGTSTDGVDAVLADFTMPQRPTILAAASVPMPDALREEFLSLNIAGHNELARAAVAANALAELYSRATHDVLAQAALEPGRVCAIGAHGQTVRHDPGAGYTVQINAAALLADRTGIDVIADFRSRDVAAGGQGAPLVPAFHQAIFAGPQPRAVLNLGGIANVTLLGNADEVRGFDTGPANVFLDMWIHASTGQSFDASGSWAGSGQAHAPLLQFLLDSEPWFELAPPKSTGRDLFNWAWLTQRLEAFGNHALSTSDIQATLQQLTAVTVAQAIVRHAPETRDVLVCGGGALNDGLMHDLRAVLPCPLRSTAEVGVPVQQVEALAFAWLARAHVQGYRAGLPSVTGARHATILGCRYPA